MRLAWMRNGLREQTIRVHDSGVPSNARSKSFRSAALSAKASTLSKMTAVEATPADHAPSAASISSPDPPASLRLYWICARFESGAAAAERAAMSRRTKSRSDRLARSAVGVGRSDKRLEPCEEAVGVARAVHVEADEVTVVVDAVDDGRSDAVQIVDRAELRSRQRIGEGEAVGVARRIDVAADDFIVCVGCRRALSPSAKPPNSEDFSDRCFYFGR